MFAAANHLAYQCGLRVVWFPDINHVEHNVEKHVMVAAGLSQVNEKVTFLARLPYGPQRDAGHWFGQMQLAFKAGSCDTIGGHAQRGTGGLSSPSCRSQNVCLQGSSIPKHKF
jgi:hypothetical protein